MGARQAICFVHHVSRFRHSCCRQPSFGCDMEQLKVYGLECNDISLMQSLEFSRACKKDVVWSLLLTLLPEHGSWTLRQQLHDDKKVACLFREKKVGIPAQMPAAIFLVGSSCSASQYIASDIMFPSIGSLLFKEFLRHGATKLTLIQSRECKFA